jgi:hypothetical protein
MLHQFQAALASVYRVLIKSKQTEADALAGVMTPRNEVEAP